MFIHLYELLTGTVDVLNIFGKLVSMIPFYSEAVSECSEKAVNYILILLDCTIRHGHTWCLHS